MDESFSSVLNTPIKKIQELSLHSPPQGRPIIYPDLSDIPAARCSINDSMLDKGYSQTLSTAVLRELDTRANEISTQAFFASSASQNSAMKKKRYSGAHKPMFQKMESISSHYAAARNKEKDAQQRDPQSSATKKRRTLNGPEEIFGPESMDSSPVHRREGQSPTPLYQRGAPLPALTATNPFSGSIPTLRAKKSQVQNPAVSSSPTRSADLKSSPSKFSRISPSKGSMNLNQLLSEDSNDDFVKPKGPVKVRQTSLQMAGVIPSGSSQSLNKKASSTSLNKKSSRPNLTDRPSTTTPKLQTKSSIPNLHKKPSFSTLENKASMSSSSSRKQLAGSQSGANLRSNATSASAFYTTSKKGSASLYGQDDPSNSSFSSTFSSRAFSSRSTTAESNDISFSGKSRSEAKSQTTKVEPFSLYSKPTISSSQKSLDPQGTLSSFSSQRSLSSQASQRSMNRFQRFKTRFS